MKPGGNPALIVRAPCDCCIDCVDTCCGGSLRINCDADMGTGAVANKLTSLARGAAP